MIEMRVIYVFCLEKGYRFKKICCKLKEMGYNNVYTIEVYNDNYSSYSEIIESKDFLQNILL